MKLGDLACPCLILPTHINLSPCQGASHQRKDTASGHSCTQFCIFSREPQASSLPRPSHIAAGFPPGPRSNLALQELAIVTFCSWLYMWRQFFQALARVSVLFTFVRSLIKLCFTFSHTHWFYEANEEHSWFWLKKIIAVVGTIAHGCKLLMPPQNKCKRMTNIKYCY